MNGIFSKVVLLCLFVSLGLCSEGLYTAIALEVEGDVTFLNDEVWEEISVDMPFSDGEQIKTGEDASLLLLYKDGQIISLDYNTDYIISFEGDMDDEPHHLWTMTEERLLHLYSNETEKQNNELRGQNITVPPGKIVSPANTKVARKNTRFYWTDDGNTMRAEIRLLKNGNEEIKKVVAEGHSYVFSTQDSPLEHSKKYKWELSAFLEMGVELSSSAEFEVLSQKEWSDLESYINDKLQIYVVAGNPNAPSALLQQARIYEENKLIADALDFHLQYSERMGPNRELVAFYRRIGFDELAFRTLHEIRDAPPPQVQQRWRVNR